MKNILSCLISLITIFPTIDQQTPKPLEYTKGDVEIKITDTLYLPVKPDTVHIKGGRPDTVVSSRSMLKYKMINNTSRNLMFDLPEIKEQYMPTLGWVRMEGPIINKVQKDTIIYNEFNRHFYLDVDDMWLPLIQEINKLHVRV